jgi:glycosyltransferase involved in cell wall biosynthesis
MNIVVAHPGTQHVPHLVRGMLKAGANVEYFTTMMYGEDSWWRYILPASLFSKRKLQGIRDDVVHRRSVLELAPSFLKIFGLAEANAYAVRNNLFQKGVRSASIRNSSAVIGFDTSSLILAQKAKDLGIPFFLELTTPHAREKQEWLQYIVNNFPEWPVDNLNKPEWLIEREDREVELATVVSGPSSYLKRTHERFAGPIDKFVVNPFGADLKNFHPKTIYNKNPRFIFLGALNAAKGIPVLLKAWKQADPAAELIIAGYGTLPAGVVLPKNVKTHGPVSKEERLAFFHSADVLVCPSLYEGLAVVQLEAAACGVTVLGTHNSGGSEFLEHGKEGLFVPPGDVNALAAAITSLCSDATKREEMGRLSALKAQAYSWEAYVDRWLKVVASHGKQRL